jgi:hypothetical protein
MRGWQHGDSFCAPLRTTVTLPPMEDLGVERVHGRPIRLLALSGWQWEDPRVGPFVLFVAARAFIDDPPIQTEIRRFAGEAIESGCCYVCAWGDGCGFVHDAFDRAAIARDRFVMSTWHADESLAEGLWFSLVNASPDEDEFPSGDRAAIVLAVEEPWIEDVRRLVADQDELARSVLGTE